MTENVRNELKDRKRIVVKIGTSTITHPKSGFIDLEKLEKFVRILVNLRNKGKEVIVVSSGAIGVGRNVLRLEETPKDLPRRQACAAVGQARLMMTYQRMFAEYNQTAGQILMTKDTILEDESRQNAHNTFEEMFRLGIIPVVNENDTVSTYEMHFGDNDTLSAIVASLTGADLLILLSDIDGLYTDDPRKNPEATLVECVEKMDAHYDAMAKQSTGSDVGTGGMATKLSAARIATASGTDMIIANGKDVGIIHQIISGTFRGTLFRAQNDETFDIHAYLQNR